MTQNNKYIMDSVVALAVSSELTNMASHARNNDRTFPELLTDFAAAVNAANNDPTDIHAAAAATVLLYRISEICARSVINKVIDPRRKDTNAAAVADSGYNPALLAVRADIGKDIATIAKQMRGQFAAHIEYNKDGATHSEIDDPDAAAALDDAATLTCGDGIDLVHTAAAALVAECAAARDRFGYVDLTAPFNIRRLKKQVLIKTDAAAAQYETVETTAIQQVFADIRRHINDSRAASTDPRNGYSYIMDYVGNDDNGNADPDSLDRIYYRAAKYADIGGGAMYGYSADISAYFDYNNIIDRLNLTERQATVLGLRIAGHGYKSIAAHLNITQRGVAKQCELIAAKAEKIGFTPATLAAAEKAAAADTTDIDNAVTALDRYNANAAAVAHSEKAARIAAAADNEYTRAAIVDGMVAAAVDHIARMIANVPALDDATAARVAAAEKIDREMYAARVATIIAARVAADTNAARVAAEKDTAARIAAAVDFLTMREQYAAAIAAARAAEKAHDTNAARVAADTADRIVTADRMSRVADIFASTAANATPAARANAARVAADTARNNHTIINPATRNGGTYTQETCTAAAAAEKAAAADHTAAVDRFYGHNTINYADIAAYEYHGGKYTHNAAAAVSTDNDPVNAKYAAAIAAANSAYFADLAAADKMHKDGKIDRATLAEYNAAALAKLKDTTKKAAADKKRARA